MKDREYPDRLAALKLSSLEVEHRQKRRDMIDLYQYLHGTYKVNNPQVELAQGRETWGNNWNLIKLRRILNTRSSFSLSVSYNNLKQSP